MPRNFCILTGIYPPDTGGPAKFAQTFSGFLSSMEIPVHVITYTNLKSHSQRENFVTVSATSRRLPVLYRYARTIHLINKQVSENSVIIANGCFIEIAILRFFRKFKYVVKIPGDIVWERARNNSVTALNILDFQNSVLPIRYWVMRRLFSYSVRSASLVITPSMQLKELALKWGAAESRTEIIYNSVRLPEWPTQHTDLQFEFVTVARLVAWKGIDQIITEVCGRGYKLLVVGDGPERNALERTAEEFPNLVHFTGEVSPAEVKHWLTKAKFFVLNSTFEATSYALLEAMSLGLVPIANSGTGSEEVIVHNLNGVLCGDKNTLSLGAAVSLLTKDPGKAQEMRIAARKTIEKEFNLEKNYLRIMNRSKSGT
jgi:glycosyltransferase involved in cell wall biosynthesis